MQGWATSPWQPAEEAEVSLAGRRPEVTGYFRNSCPLPMAQGPLRAGARAAQPLQERREGAEVVTSGGEVSRWAAASWTEAESRALRPADPGHSGPCLCAPASAPPTSRKWLPLVQSQLLLLPARQAVVSGWDAHLQAAVGTSSHKPGSWGGAEIVQEHLEKWGSWGDPRRLLP